MLKRVLEIITAADYAMPGEKTLDEALAELALAYHQLEAGHWWTQWLSELRTLADIERWEVDSAIARLEVPQRWERFQRGLDHSLAGMDRAQIPRELHQGMRQQQYDQSTSKIASSILSRRWQQHAAVSIADDLDAKHAAFAEAGQEIVPALNDARRRIRLYENYRDLQKRVGEVLYRLDKEYSDKNILVVGHAGSLIAMEYAGFGFNPKEAEAFYNEHGELKNGEVRKLVFTPLPHNYNYELDFLRPVVLDRNIHLAAVLVEEVRLLRAEEFLHVLLLGEPALHQVLGMLAKLLDIPGWHELRHDDKAVAAEVAVLLHRDTVLICMVLDLLGCLIHHCADHSYSLIASGQRIMDGFRSKGNRRN
jgi:hypothetical protein